jgi:hypothetical protein
VLFAGEESIMSDEDLDARLERAIKYLNAYNEGGKEVPLLDAEWTSCLLSTIYP